MPYLHLLSLILAQAAQAPVGGSLGVQALLAQVASCWVGLEILHPARLLVILKTGAFCWAAGALWVVHVSCFAWWTHEICGVTALCQRLKGL